jgi:hypothetical protein
MAEMSQSVPQFQNPDYLGSYLRGLSAPGQLVAQQQQNELGVLNIEQTRLALGNQQAISQYARQGLSQMGAQGQGMPPGGIQNGPQGVQGVDPGYQGSDYHLPTPPQPAIDPRLAPYLGAIGGTGLLDGAQKGFQMQQEARDSAVKQAQLQASGPLGVFDAVSNSPSPARMAMNNPSIMALWPKAAQALGLDPVKDFNDTNVARAAIFGGNQVRQSVGMSPREMPLQEQNRTLADGTIISQNPNTKAITVPYKPDLQKTIGADGQPTLTPPAQAVGQKPFESTVYAADQLTPGAVQTAADFFRTNGKMPEGFSRNPLSAGKVYNQAYTDATASGDTMGAINARAAALGANKEALEQVTKLQTSTAGYAATLDKNLNSLLALQGQVDSSGVPLLNKVYRAWQQGVSGDPDVAKYVTYLSSAQGEFAKLKSGNLGNAPASDAAMKDAGDIINKFMPNGTIAGVADAMRGEAGNRTGAIQEQVNFVKSQLGVNAPTANAAKQNSALPPTNAQGWTLHRDASGNQAYVSPDRKQFQEVR